MAQSKDVLDLLDLLDKIGLDIGFLWGFVHDESKKGGQLFDYCKFEEGNDVKQTRDLLTHLWKSRQGSVLRGRDELFQKLSKVVQDEHLNETITRLELWEVPGIVGRWKKIRTIPTRFIPGEKVEAYLRQAVTCYLYGLPNAAAGLCRSVLQFALEEALEKLGGIDLGGIRCKDYLFNLIDFASKMKIKNTEILPDPLPRKAHEIREVGNKSLHTSGLSDSKALATLEQTAEILSHIYGRTGQRGR